MADAARDLDVLCLGETLVDFLPEGPGPLGEAGAYQACPGGAPANVATGLARLGLRVGFAGVTGDDPFGSFLATRLAAERIQVRLRLSAERPTGLWFVALDQQGDRTFFSPNARVSADKLVSPEDVRAAGLDRATWLHVGSSAHVAPPGREALRFAVAEARRLGTRVSFDPNVRAHLWEDLGECARLCREVIPACALVKVSAEEAELCTGERDPERALAALAASGVALAVITMGEHGALLRRGDLALRVPAEPARVVDTTGAGDAFVAGLLAAIAREGPPERLSPEALLAAGRLGARVAAGVVASPGAVAGLPRRDQASASGSCSPPAPGPGISV